MYQVTLEFVDRLQREGYDVWTISLWQNWLSRMADFQSAVAAIEKAFIAVKLGDGVGMLEANGRDDYADETELSRLRELDERNYWQHISSDELNQYYCSFGYCDAEGGRFLLPAYLLCDLRDEYQFGFASELIYNLNRKRQPLPEYPHLLDFQQASALSELFTLLKCHPDFYSLRDRIDLAVQAIHESTPNASEE